MNYPLSELIDRYTILLLKKERLPADKQISKEVITFRKAIDEFEHPKTTEYIDDLLEVNGKIWDLESDIRKGKEKQLGCRNRSYHFAGCFYLFGNYWIENRPRRDFQG